MRLVIKVGTSTLTYQSGWLNIRRMERLCKVLSDLMNAGNEVILVSSGAIAMGVGKLSLKSRPQDMPTKQAAAAVGQCELMYNYDKLFSEYHRTAAQILITADDVDDGTRRENFVNTLSRLLELGVIPVINENDTVATGEITSVGDNDTLAAIVAQCVKADLVVLLSDIDGLYSADPHLDGGARLISVVGEITDDIISLAGGSAGSLGTGGMLTKVRAAKTCTEFGADMVIANGSDPEILYDILDGAPAGTRFKGKKK